MALGDIGPAACRHPALDAPLARVFNEIQGPRVSAMFWALGTHFGRMLRQPASVA